MQNDFQYNKEEQINSELSLFGIFSHEDEDLSARMPLTRLLAPTGHDGGVAKVKAAASVLHLLLSFKSHWFSFIIKHKVLAKLSK